MKIVPLEFVKMIMDNPHSKHNYFGWPSAVRLKNGKIAVAASGFRLSHICPFGKVALAFSEDEGKSYTRPSIVIDTILDDRDAGLTPFGENGLIVTSFNNRLELQRSYNTENAYVQKYLDLVTEEEEREHLGATFRISQDGGVTFGPIHHSPVTSPHGPIALKDGTILWVGRMFQQGERYSFDPENRKKDYIAAYELDPKTGNMTYLGRIENLTGDEADLYFAEPYAMQLPDGSLICHIRTQEPSHAFKLGTFTIYQSRSYDGGRTWTKPRRILSQKEGAPAHLLMHSSGTLICAYSHREEPYGIRCALSRDLGETWSEGHWIYQNHVSPDLGYPATVELTDGSLLTVFYARPKEGEPAVIMQQKWRLE